MRAAVLTDKHTFEVAEVPDPSPGADELVLRVSACGICGSDLKGHTVMPAGVVLGHEFCGEVVAVGPGGRDEAGKLIPIDLKVGDRVLFGKWSGTEVKIDGEDRLIMKESDVMGVIEGASATKKKAA